LIAKAKFLKFLTLVFKAFQEVASTLKAYKIAKRLV
jgi:hypothetical protein